MNANDITPTQAGRRIDTLDLLRGIAICGILLMNIPVMGAIAYTQGLTYPAAWNADWIAYIIQALFFEGSMRGLFTLLFGAALLLMVRGASGPGAVDAEAGRFDVWARRCLVLMVLGVVQFAIFLWPGEILWNYGLSGLFLLAFRPLRPRALLIWAGIVLAGLSLIAAGVGYERGVALQASVAAQEAKAAGKVLSEEQSDALKQVAEMRAKLHPTPAAVKAEVAQRTSFPGVVMWSLGMWAEANLSGQAWLGLLESLGFMLIGMALLRTGILSGDASVGTYWRMAAIGYTLGLGLRLAGMAYSARAGFDIVPALAIPLVQACKSGSYELARLAMALGHLGLIVGLYRRGVLGKAWPLRAMGRMALTIYSLQSILTSALFYGLGLVGHFGFAGLMGLAVAIWLLSCAFATWWLSFRAMGPAEYVLRRFSYGATAMRRNGPVLREVEAARAA